MCIVGVPSITIANLPSLECHQKANSIRNASTECGSKWCGCEYQRYTNGALSKAIPVAGRSRRNPEQERCWTRNDCTVWRGIARQAGALRRTRKKYDFDKPLLTYPGRRCIKRRRKSTVMCFWDATINIVVAPDPNTITVSQNGGKKS